MHRADSVGASLVVAREVDGLFGGYPQGAPLRVCKRYIQFKSKKTVGWASARLLTIYAGMKDLVVDLFCVGGRLKPTLRGSER